MARTLTAVYDFGGLSTGSWIARWLFETASLGFLPVLFAKGSGGATSDSPSFASPTGVCAWFGTSSVRHDVVLEVPAGALVAVASRGRWVELTVGEGVTVLAVRGWTGPRRAPRHCALTVTDWLAG